MASQSESSAKQTSPAGDPAARTRRPRGCGGIFLFFMLIVAALWGSVLGSFVAVLDQAQATIEGLDAWRPKVGSKVLTDDEGEGSEILGEFTTNNRQLLSLSAIPLKLQKAFISREDDEFYTHKGVRPDAILNSMWYILRTGNLRGGSTVTQQLVRNVDIQGFPDKTQTLKRKLQEAIVALQVERKFTKDEILELYLNQIFLGVSANGVEAAAQQYFGRSCRDLTLGECALLAALAKTPNNLEPFTYPDAALRERNVVLNKMLKDGFITSEEHAAALAEPLEQQVISKEERIAQRAQAGNRWAPGTTLAPYFVEEVRQQVLSRRPKDEVFEGGLLIYTTLDMRLQRAAENALFKTLDEFDAKKREALAKDGKESEFVPVTGALVCLDNRPGCEGYIRAMVGGRDFAKQKYNTVTQAKRQPGSSIKPYVWVAALDNGMTPSDIMMDTPFEQVKGLSVWRPQNFDGKFSGPITLRRAIEKSVNIVSIKLVQKLGVPTVRSYMQRAGITSDIPDYVSLTLGLGTPEVTVLDQCVAYSTFAKGGVRTRPTMIKEIQDRDGFTIYKSQIEKEPDALKPDLCYAITYLLEGVATYGTGARSAKLGRPRAGKTGTTNDSRDVWFCGYTPDYTCVVWIGYRDNRSLGRGINYTGGRLACPVWTDFMIAAEEGLPVRDFPVPEGVEFHNIDRETGLAGGNFSEAYIRGAGPVAERNATDFGDTGMGAETVNEEQLLAPL